MLPRRLNSVRAAHLLAVLALPSLAAPALAAEMPADETACAAAPSPQCVFALAAQVITEQKATEPGADPFVAVISRDALDKFAHATVLGLARAGALDQAASTAASLGQSPLERADLLLDTIAEVPQLSRAVTATPIIKEGLAKLDPFTDLKATGSLSEYEQTASISRWLDLIRAAHAAGLQADVRASVAAAASALGSSSYVHLDADTQSRLADAAGRAAVAGDEFDTAESVSFKIVGADRLKQFRVELAGAYARRNDVDRARSLLEGIGTSDRIPADAEIMASLLRQGKQAWGPLWVLPSDVQTRVLVDAVDAGFGVNVLTILHATTDAVQAIVRAAFASHLAQVGQYSAALTTAGQVRTPWIRLAALSVVAIEAARHGDAAVATQARNLLDLTNSGDVTTGEYLDAGFVSAFAGSSTMTATDKSRTLSLLQSRIDRFAPRTVTTPEQAQIRSIVDLSLLAFRMAVGDEQSVLHQIQLPTYGTTASHFAQAFAAGTAYGLTGDKAAPLVAHALAQIASVVDPQERLALLVVLGQQMEDRHVVYGYGN